MKQKTLPRFFVPDLDPSVGSAALLPDEAAHLTRVLRTRVGDRVAVFDGRGREFVARVTAASRRHVRVELEERITPAAECPVLFTLAQAALKGDKMDQVVRDAVMLGAARIVPLLTHHVAVKTAALERGKPEERWSRVALASVKQCGRAIMPIVESPQPLEAFLDTCRAPLKLLFVEPSADDEVVSLRSFLDVPPPSSAALLVGPEGGWSTEERRAAAAAGCVPVTLGSLTLRADAVAVAAISIVRFLWER